MLSLVRVTQCIIRCYYNRKVKSRENELNKIEQGIEIRFIQM